MFKGLLTPIQLKHFELRNRNHIYLYIIMLSVAAIYKNPSRVESLSII